MMQHVIPHDTRLASLVTKRDFSRYSVYFSIMQRYITEYSSEDNFTQDLEYELMKLSLPLYDLYTITLIERFVTQDNTFAERWDSLHIEITTPNYNVDELFENYKELILDLEKILDIERDVVALNAYKVNIGAKIYEIDYKRMQKVLNQTVLALGYLNEELDKNPQLHSQDDKQQELDYLIKVVIFEIWNYISHICHANTAFFKTPLDFISDLEKATSHLKRAIMDIYDGLIVDIYESKITPEYLKIRNKKIMSLGQTKEIYSVTEELKNYYLKIRDY